MRIGLRNKPSYPASESNEDKGRHLPTSPHRLLMQGECEQQPKNSPA